MLSLKHLNHIRKRLPNSSKLWMYIGRLCSLHKLALGELGSRARFDAGIRFGEQVERDVIAMRVMKEARS
jgi:hypothetical protein